VIPYLLAALGGYLIGESTKSKLLDNAANDSITDAGLEVASASVLAKGGTINSDIRFDEGGLYYRAETSNDFVKEKIFEPNGYYERVGKDGNPVIKYDEYVISDTPEIAASKTIYGAILGAASMMKFSKGIKKDNKIQIYLIDEKPDVDISHWQGADFEYLDEVRYRNSIVGKHLITYELTDDVYRLVKDFYEYKEWENNSKYDDQLEFDNRLEYIYQMIEDEKFYPTLKKLIDKSI